MRAFALDEFGKPGSVREVPAPQVEEGEILVRVRAAAVNVFDVFVVSGMAKDMMEHRFPLIPGVDAAGVVERVREGVTQFEPGDELFGLFGKPFIGEGTFAEYVTGSAAGLIARKPAPIDFFQAAALPTAGLTALESVNALDPKDGQTVLMIGAAGGVGSYAVQLATRRGARVIATAEEGQEEYLRGLGAAQVIDYQSGDVIEAVKHSHPEGIDGLIDVVNRDGEALARNAQILRRGGRLASSLGAANIESLAQQGITATNVMAGATTGPQGLDTLSELVAAGELKVPIDSVFPLEEAGAALTRLQTGGVRGKVVVKVGKGLSTELCY